MVDWKKEISFGRKPKQDAEPIAEPVELAVEAVAQQAAASTSIWKKELSFGRKSKAPKAEQETVVEQPFEAALEAVPPAKQSIWKRELSFSRKPKADAADEDTAADTWALGETLPPEPAPVPAEEPRVPAGSAYAFLADREEPAAVTPEPPATAPEPPETIPSPEPPLAPPAPEPTFPPPVPEPTYDPPAPEPTFPQPDVAAVSEAAQPQPAPVPMPPAEPAPPAPPLPPAAVQAPPPVVHPPVPASELPPLDEEQERKQPFWKREVSLGRKERAPKAEKEPKQRKERKPKGEKPEKEPKAPRLTRAERKAQKAAGGVEPVAAEGGALVKASSSKELKGKDKTAPKKLVGLKIGASQIAAARVSNNGSVELQQVARDELDDGIVVGGELRDPEALSEALKRFFAKHKLPKSGVRLGIANNRIGVRTFEISGIDDGKQLANAIRFRAQEALPIPIEEAVLDYQVLGETVDEEGVLTRRILLVVAYRELIDRYVDACRKAGIKLVGIDLEAFALLRALAAPQQGAGADPTAALVAVSVGHERSTFAVSDGRVCEFTRVLEWGGSALNVAVARALDVSPSEADPFKRLLSLTEPVTIAGLTAEQSAAALEAVRKQIQSFARELVSSLQFYQGQPGSLGIGEIVLTGGTAHLPGLAEELQRLIGVRVRVGDPLNRVKVGKKIREPEQVGSYAVAIGLGIED